MSRIDRLFNFKEQNTPQELFVDETIGLEIVLSGVILTVFWGVTSTITFYSWEDLESMVQKLQVF